MKKSTLNQSLACLALLITFSTPLCGMNIGTRLKSKLTSLKWKIKAHTYNKSTTITDCAMFIGSKFAYHYLKYINKKDPSNSKKIIEHQLTEIKNNLKEEQLKIINAIAKDYNMTDEQLQSIERLMSKYKDVGEKYIQQWSNYFPSPYFYEHADNPAFPDELIPLLKKNNICPDNVKLKIMPSADGNTFATASCYIFEHYDCRTPNPHGWITSKPEIELYPLYFNGSKIEQLSTLMHEIGHIINQDVTTTQSILGGICLLTGTPQEQIKNNKYYEQLKTYQEHTAEMLPALKFKEDATTLRLNRKINCYPKQLYGKHYFKLALVDTLHKLNDKLTE